MKMLLSRKKSTFFFSFQLHLMKSDIDLWKKLQELDTSLAVVKQNFDYACSDTLSSASSGTESFVSAEEYNDLIFSKADDDRVKLWIEKSDFRNDENHRPSSEAFSDIDISAGRKWHVQENLHKAYIIEQLVNSFKVSNSVSNRKENNKNSHINYLQDLLNSYTLEPTIVVDSKQALTMKSMKEIEIISREDITYYKSSLRLLGSVRMQSRIFEPSLTKWRPFALSQTSDSFIIVPPSSFSSIQPRPKLHRLANVSERGQIYLKAFLNETHKRPEHKAEADDLNENIDDTDISEASSVTACKESEENTDSETYLCQSSDLTCEEIKFKKKPSEESEEVEIDLFGSDFLELKDGFITCRILPADIDEMRQPLLDQDEFEYLKIDNGRVTFTPYEKDTDNGDTYFLGWLFENKDDDEESFYIHKLFEEADDDGYEIKDNMNIIGYLFKDVHQDA